MKKFIQYIQDYIKGLDIKDFAFLKSCLLALGILTGVMLPRRYKRPVFLVTGVIFGITYFYSMRKFLKGLLTLCD